MITLTNSVQVTTTLGSASKTAYDKLSLLTMHYEIGAMTITGACKLFSSAAPSALDIQGSYSIDSVTGKLTVSIPNLPFFASLTLSAGQKTTVQGWITSAQASIEGGMVTVGVIQGVQS